MPKTLKCGDLMPGCRAVIEGMDVDEVMTKAAAHAAKDHGITNVTPELAQREQGAIRDEWRLVAAAGRTNDPGHRAAFAGGPR